MKNRTFIILLTLLLTVVLGVAAIPQALAETADNATTTVTENASGGTEASQSPTTIRVGWYSEGSLSGYTTSGQPAGYTYDYLMAIAQYANWKYEFVDAPLSDCISMLKSGEVDIVAGLIHTPERDQTIGFTTQPIGSTLKYLLVRQEDRRFGYEEYSSFNGMVIGVTAGNAGIDNLAIYAQKNDFAYTTKEYATEEDLFNALISGEVDAIMVDNTQSNRGEDVIATFSNSPLYIATAIDNTQLIDELDRYLTQIDYYYPTFNEDLYNKYYRYNSTSSPVFTKSELAYIQEHPQVTVIYDSEWYPLEYLDKTSNSYAGIVPDILKIISEKSGLSFVPQATIDSADSIFAIGPDMGDAISSMTCDFAWADQHEVLITQPILQCNMTRVTATSDYDNLKTAAVIEGDFIGDRVSELYPDLTLMRYPNAEKCLDAVKSGESDCAFLTAYETDYYLSNARYNKLTYQTVNSFAENICLCVGKNCDPRLFTILSKSIASISYTQLDSIVHKNTDINAQATLLDVVYLHPVESVLMISLIVILAAVGIVLLLKNRQRHRENATLALASKAKTDFLSRMSHDMRTPMNAVLGLSKLTLDMKDLPDEAVSNMNKIISSSQYLLGLINDTLDMSKIEHGSVTLDIQPLAIKTFLDSLRPIIQTRADESKVMFASPQSNITVTGIFADRLRLQQILLNLLNNAIKFTPPGGQVFLTFEQLSLVGDTITIQAKVEDTGTGISDEFLPHLFEPFSQEYDSKVKVDEGSGLGLAIVKNLVEFMDGTIEAQSTKGKGSIFTVTIPFKVATEQDILAAQSETVNGIVEADRLQGVCILLAEDHPVNTEIAVKLLEKMGCVVECATNGQEAVDLFASSAEGHFDVVLMDIQMPVKNGYEASKDIRNLPREDAATVSIVAMTANAFDDDVQNSHDAGMDAHVAKPIDVQELYRTIARLTGR